MRKSGPDVPKYDPETGELVDAFELADSELKYPPHPSLIPMAKSALTTAAGLTRNEPSLAQGFARMFTPPNLAVMGAIFLMHVLLWPLQFVVSAGVFFLGLAIPAVLAAIASHYGNVVEDMGPFEKDDFPRPLRDIEWYGDIWVPFCNVFCSLLLCYWLLMPLSIELTTMQNLPPSVPILLMSVVAGLGTFVFPGVLLTLVGSGTSHNLRPDRVWSVISKCGAAYFFTTIVWMAAAGTYVWGFVGSSMAIAGAMNMTSGTHWYLRWRLVAPMLIVSIILMHYFCYCVAILYRVHHGEFPWVLQKHVRTPKGAGGFEVVAPPNRPQRKPRPVQVKPR